MTTGAPDPSGLSGRIISHFRVLEPLGAGGMGVVYRAEDVRLNRTVALKFMLPGYAVDQEAAGRFVREARSAAALDHPNICTVHEVGESEDGQLFLAMSYYAGETLKDRLTRRGPVPLDAALDIASQIARGLACAHAAGVVHRDLKPANVMLTGSGAVKILDFGIAKALDQTITVSGVAMGTVAYMSPEQLFGEHVDGRSDLWSLGVVLVEMVTGRHPTARDDVAATFDFQVESHQDRPLNPELSGSLKAVVDRLLRRNPEERYQTVEDVLADLTTLRDRIATRTQPAALPAPSGSPRTARRNLLLGAVAALGVFAVALGVARWRESSGTQAAVRTPAGSAAETRATSVAVLPLKNYSSPDQEYFADGMTEEVTTTLSKIEALRVIPHQSVAQFKRSDRPVPEIARLLDVKYVVDGSLRQNDGHVRITASLIDASRNSSVWSETFEGDRRDAMELQRKVALAIAQAVQVKLTPQDRARLEPTRPVDPEAFDLYMRGTRARYDANFTGDFTDATRYLSAAIAKDSGFAAAYAGLAFIAVFGGDQVRARPLVDKALALDSKLAEGHMVRGMVRQFFDWNWSGAENDYREAIALNRAYAEAHHELSMLLMRQKRFPEALREGRSALSIEPMSARFLNGIGEVEAFSGRHAEALAVADQLIAVDSAFLGSYYIQGIAFEQAGRLADAEQAWLRTNPVGFRARLGYIYARTGRRKQALQVLDTLATELRNAKDKISIVNRSQDIAIVHVGLGHRDEAMTWLERAASERVEMLYLGIDPLFRSLHDEPRFQALLKKIGLPTS